MAVVIKGSGSIEGSTGLEMGANGTTEIRGQVNVALGSSVAGDSYTSGISTASNFTPTSIPTSNRNLIINGAMQVAQRATSSTSNGYKTIDRWYYECNGADEAATIAQADVTADSTPWNLGFRKCLKVTNGNQTGGAGSSDAIDLVYAVEAQDLATSGWDYTSTSSYITFSFWIKSSVAQNFYGYMRSQDGTSKDYAYETGSLTADTWTKVTKTVPGDSGLTVTNDNGKGLAITILPFMGTGSTNNSKSLNSWANIDNSARTPDNTSTWWTTNDATFEITGVQLEVGSVATPFEHRSYGDELLRCQRYYQVVVRGSDYGSGIAPICMVHGYQANNAFGVVDLPVTMRAEPSLDAVSSTAYWKVFRNAGSGDFNSLQLDQCSNSHVELNFYGVSSGTSIAQNTNGWARSNDSSAFIGLQSEL